MSMAVVVDLVDSGDGRGCEMVAVGAGDSELWVWNPGQARWDRRFGGRASHDPGGSAFEAYHRENPAMPLDTLLEREAELLNEFDQWRSTAVGRFPALKCDTWRREGEPGLRFMLASDGVNVEEGLGVFAESGVDSWFQVLAERVGRDDATLLYCKVS